MVVLKLYCKILPLPVGIQSNNGQTALIFAAERGHDKIATYFLRMMLMWIFKTKVDEQHLCMPPSVETKE